MDLPVPKPDRREVLVRVDAAGINLVDTPSRDGYLDLGIQHSDSYFELRDRAKDIVISGGENISTVEIEHTLESHHRVLAGGVIGVPDDKWGERPKAFVMRMPKIEVNEAELIAYLHTHIARFKVPKAIEFQDQLPRTSTARYRSSPARKGTGWTRQPYPRDDANSHRRTPLKRMFDHES